MLERVTRREKQKKALTGALREVHEARLRDVTNGTPKLFFNNLFFHSSS